MTRINTNVSSLIAQNTLGTSNNQLQEALTRLSTGLRINTGKDDPAGLIASETLRSNIISLEKSISNTERANQVIATADSALGQVSSLLNDIRGLVVEAANSGALSDEEVAANQVQVDSSLEALNRIAQTTSFGGRNLLDGSLEFVTTPGSNFTSTVSNLQIDQANLGTAGQISVDVEVTSAAQQATLTNSGGFSAAAAANTQLTFAAEVDSATFTSGAQIKFQATTAGTSFEGVQIQTIAQTGVGAGNETASYDATNKILTITIDDTAGTTAANLAAAVNNGVAEFHADVLTGGAVTQAEADAINLTTVADFLTITAASNGPQYNDVAVSVLADASVAAGSPTATYDSTANTLVIRVNNTANTTLANIVTAFGSVAEFGAAASSTAADETLNIDGGNVADFGATANTGNTGGGTLNDSLVLQINGNRGGDVFNFGSGSSINDITNAINLVSDATGVNASFSGTALTLTTTDYGSDAFVDVNVISEGSSGTFLNGFSGTTRDTGADIAATVNGVAANGKANTLSINTATLDLTATVNDGSSQDFQFTIDGGGALFQIGPEVVSNQQARIGITSVNAGRLGGASGKLYQLGSGESASLANDTVTGAKIVDEVIDQVTGLRGRLGAFQKTTLETNIAALNDTLANITDAESSIRDADFARESAALTRAQILVQSGTSVLSIANNNPQNVLALLR